MMHLGIIGFARLADNLRLIRGAIDDEPRVNRDTMPANAGARLQNIDARVAIGQPDHFPHIEALLIRNHRKLVRKGNIHIAKSVFNELGHFGGIGIGDDAFALHKALVESERLPSAARCNPAD